MATCGSLCMLIPRCDSQVSKAILGEKKPLTTRPSAALPPADFSAVKSMLQGGKCGKVLGEVTDELVVSYLLYPKVSSGQFFVSVKFSLLPLPLSPRNIRCGGSRNEKGGMFVQVLSAG